MAQLNVNMKLRWMPTDRSPFTHTALNDATDCFMHMCAERKKRDGWISRSPRKASNPCTECGAPQADWETTHHLYETWSGKCPACKAAFIAEDAAYSARMDH